jgi:hypothetical protein
MTQLSGPVSVVAKMLECGYNKCESHQVSEYLEVYADAEGGPVPLGEIALCAEHAQKMKDGNLGAGNDPIVICLEA